MNKNVFTIQMMKFKIVLFGCLIFALSCQTQKKDMIKTEAPVAKKESKELVKHDDAAGR